MDKAERLLEIIATYDRFRPELEARGIEFGETDGGGIWTPTILEHLIPFLSSTTRHIIPPPGPIVDAGSGDGRVSAVLDVYGFNPIVNIELDERLVDASRVALDDLTRRGVVNGNIRTVQGDFTKPQAYDEAGIPFDSVRYFYMGINDEPLEKLAQRIERESPKGTTLVVYGMFLKEGHKPNIPFPLISSVRTEDNLADFLVYRK